LTINERVLSLDDLSTFFQKKKFNKLQARLANF